jgi:hypothetical protein
MTDAVPKNGLYHVVHQGGVVGSFRRLPQALAMYRRIIEESGWEPPKATRPQVDPSKEAVERYMDDLTEYWGTSHAFRRRGAKRA